MSEFKTCPHCDSEIQAKAIKCKYCKELISGEIEGVTEQANTKTRKWGNSPAGIVLGVFMGLIVVAIIILIPSCGHDSMVINQAMDISESFIPYEFEYNARYLEVTEREIANQEVYTVTGPIKRKSDQAEFNIEATITYSEASGHVRWTLHRLKLDNEVLHGLDYSQAGRKGGYYDFKNNLLVLQKKPIR